MAADIVEYEGQPVAAIAAGTFDQARAAARLVEIDYEPLPAILTVEEAIARDSFVSPPQTMVRGEVEPALAGAPHRLSGEVRCRRPGPLLSRRTDRARGAGRRRRHPRMELDPAPDRSPARGRASPRPALQRRHRRGAADGRRVRRQGEPGDHHRRHRRRARLQGAAAGEAAAAARRRHASDRQAPSIPDPVRRRVRRRGAYPRARPHLAADAAAWPITRRPCSTRALCHADNCYFLPHLRFRGLPCKTNTVSNTAFRGYGGPQGMLAIETIIEAIARRLGLPVRRRPAAEFLWQRPQRRDALRHDVEDNIIERVVDRARSHRRPCRLAAHHREASTGRARW